MPMNEETKMCEKNTERADPKAKNSSEEAEPEGQGGCPCEPKRCLPVAGAVLATVAVTLVIRAIKRSRQSHGKQARTPRGAGCCT